MTVVGVMGVAGEMHRARLHEAIADGTVASAGLGQRRGGKDLRREMLLRLQMMMMMMVMEGRAGVGGQKGVC